MQKVFAAFKAMGAWLNLFYHEVAMRLLDIFNFVPPFHVINDWSQTALAVSATLNGALSALILSMVMPQCTIVVRQTESGRN